MICYSILSRICTSGFHMICYSVEDLYRWWFHMICYSVQDLYRWWFQMICYSVQDLYLWWFHMICYSVQDLYPRWLNMILRKTHRSVLIIFIETACAIYGGQALRHNTVKH
jgi:hypothetical protein